MIAHYSPFIFWFTFFGVFHSVAAQEGFKNYVAKLIHPDFISYYWRAIYFLTSFYLYYGPVSEAFRECAAKFPSPLWIYPEPVQTMVRGLYLGGVLICYSAFIQADYLSFIGLKQLWAGLRTHVMGSPNDRSISIFGTNHLVVSGIYRWVRHPMLLGVLILVIATVRPTVGTAIQLALALSYIAVGVYFEEKRLVRLFGNDYLRYQKSVGAFLPRIPVFSEKKDFRC